MNPITPLYHYIAAEQPEAVAAILNALARLGFELVPGTFHRDTYVSFLVVKWDAAPGATFADLAPDLNG